MLFILQSESTVDVWSSFDTIFLVKKEAKYFEIEKLQNHVSEKVLHGVTRCYKVLQIFLS